ncbi:solute carrier family 12 member 8 isoform 2 [Mus musculus]|uniref:Isoform 3 of Solute carrier family 12 member 8 n=3 Tax=Mus musculus TaxID=10090 RepID=Q8VI23-3|nr:solute carrier family 12 member 8 isoform 2 [Mus musculus]AAH30926.1 Slc12a8 protein [Mus musculus]EDK97847.1 solute carrier family 12 (potassium/chloride transporters), member 8, isoform CRA_f [Mus musculus]|eukprot:NP_001077371.1 solute carrier family 12 member 8 isoform 2 [Mus musculus]
MWEPVLFGTWDGVFTSCMINIFGVVLFLRTGWLVGNTGVLLGLLLVSFVVLVALITVLSGIGVAEHGGISSGGVYSMISSVLGGQMGGTVGLLYVFGQCVAGAMYITGFAESISDLLGLGDIWAVRGISVAVLLALLGINLAGVKWIIRLQLLLLLLLAVSTLDFVVGSFTHLDPEHGFIGYSPELLQSNILPEYSPGESFFTVFGVFFPAATGVMAGFNMGGDLRDPADSVPLGSLAAVGVSWFLYIIFAFLLGAVCTREALRSDFLIAEKKGPNKTPVAAICLTSLVTMAFVLVGQVNVLAPVVTINFMLTYIMVDYSYFALSMAHCGLAPSPEPVPRQGPDTLHCSEHLLQDRAPSYGSDVPARSLSEGTLLEFTKDMDQFLQPIEELESRQLGSREGNNPKNQKRKGKKGAKQTLQDSFLLDPGSPLSFPTRTSERLSVAFCGEQESYQKQQTSRSESHDHLVPDLRNQPRVNREDFFLKCRLQEQEIQRRPSVFYACMCNPWVSLLGALASLLIMFVIQWLYTLASMGVAALVYFYIGQASPGLYLGSASNFSFFQWMKSFLVPSCRSLRSAQEQIILAPSPAKVDMAMTQLTQDNADFATRDRYHHSSFLSREQLMPPY